MKLMRLIDGSEFRITDVQADRIAKNVDRIRFVELDGGILVNVASISSIKPTSDSRYIYGRPVFEERIGSERKLYFFDNLPNGEKRKRYLADGEERLIKIGEPDGQPAIEGTSKS